MEPETTTQNISIEALLEENLRLKKELKRQKDLYEDSHAELIKYMIETEVASKKLTEANKRLGQTFSSAVEIIQRIIDLRCPGYFEHSQRVARISKAIAENINQSKGRSAEVYLAARIHEIGKMSLPDGIIGRSYEEMEEEEIKLIRNHYLIAATCLEKIPQFIPISKTIKHIRENVDGSGLPDGLEGDKIPIGSRIIAMVDFFDTRFFVHRRCTSIDETFDLMQEKLGVAFDPDLIGAVQEEIRKRFSNEDAPKDVQVKLNDLTPGMVLSKDVYTITNVLLIPRGVELTETLIHKLQSYQSTDPIRGGIFIQSEGEGK
ncbi:MAG: HD domain-containing protein [Calditrichaeota bacterium]|nr:MAG: HD domain-containing protein [Calditrichota bacterium]